MSRCNVDFFDLNLNYIYHDTIETPGIDFDYLTPEGTRFEIGWTDAIPVKCFARIEGHDNYVAMVENVDIGEYTTTITVKPFQMLFDQSVMFNTRWQYQDPIPAGTNLITFDFEGRNINGIVWALNEDNTITANGVATAASNIIIGYFEAESGKSYDVSSSVSGGSLNTYYLTMDNADSSQQIAAEFGTGMVISGQSGRRNIALHVASGVTLDNLKFTPRVVDRSEEVITPDPNTENISLEIMILSLIQQYWVNDEPNIPLNIIVPSPNEQITKWSFGLVGDKKDEKGAARLNIDHYCIVEMYDAILQNALTRYRVSVEGEFDLVRKRINVYIGRSSNVKTIETAIPDVNVVEFSIGRMEADINKLQIWNEEKYSWDSVITYYLHTDGKYNQDSKSDRIKPIKMEVISTSAEYEYEKIEEPDLDANPHEEGWYENCDGDYKITNDTHVPYDEETESYEEDYYIKKTKKSFDVAAKEQADQRFGDIRWRNYIELEMSNNNTFDAQNLRIGQLVNIVHQGRTYETILTGKVLGDYLTLIFGTLRVDLTKKDQLDESAKYTETKSVTKDSITSSS